MKEAEKQMKVILMFLPKKILIWNYWTILGQKTAHPRNSGSTVGTFLHNERGQGVDGSYGNGFPKTVYKDFLKILHNERGKEVL